MGKMAFPPLACIECLPASRRRMSFSYSTDNSEIDIGQGNVALPTSMAFALFAGPKNQPPTSGRPEGAMDEPEGLYCAACGTGGWEPAAGGGAAAAGLGLGASCFFEGAMMACRIVPSMRGMNSTTPASPLSWMSLLLIAYPNSRC